MEVHLKICKRSVPTLQETRYAFIINPNRLMLFGKRIAVYCDNHMEYLNIFCGKNTLISNINAFGAGSNHWALGD
jgi:hypothetical protein